MAEEGQRDDLAVAFSQPSEPPDANTLADDFQCNPESTEGVSFEGAEKVPVKVLRLPHFQGLPPLKAATPGSAGIDLYAAITDPIRLNTVGSSAIIPTGIKLEIPVGFEVQIRPRSGLAANHGVTVLNTPGTIDSDYRGEIKVILINMGTKRFTIQRGDRIAQMLVKPVIVPVLSYVEELSETTRGQGGLGSTGT